MKDCIHRVIEEIGTGESPDIRERLLEAALLIEKFGGLTDDFSVSPAVGAAETTPEGISDLRAALVHFAQHHREHSDVGSALWALGKLHDNSLRNFFLKEMRHHLQARRHHPVWQADIALDNLGDGVNYDYAPGETSHDHYFQAVRDYLDRHGA